MSVDTPSTDEVQTVLDDLGADVDLEHEDVDVGFDFETRDGMEFTNATIVKPVIARRNEPVGEIEKEVMIDGHHAIVTVQKRPECPACSYIPTQEDEPITLTGRCVKCEQWTCPNCGADCFSCDQRLCRDHKDGYGMMGEVLCGKHRRDVEREKEAEWKAEFWERHIEEESVLLEHETQREIAFKELELDAEIQREQMELDAEIQRRQQKLAEFEAKSEHLDREKQRDLDEKQFKLDKAQTMLEEKREATRLALDEELERRQQNLKEWQAKADQSIAEAEQALEVREQEFKEEIKRRQQDQEEYEFEKEREDDRYEFDEEHQLKRDEHELDREKHRHEADMDQRKHELDKRKHETEREDNRAERDLDQQKRDIERKKAEVDEWVKKRRQMLAEFKAVTQAKNGKNLSDGQTSGKKPSWEEIVKITQQLDEMKDIDID
jgi:DNA repair exonuclease SbcCD ATPase subunit